MNMKRMSKWVVAVAAALAATVGHAGDSAPFALDTRTGTRVARETEPIAYSTEWSQGANVQVSVDGVLLKTAAAPASGTVVWNAAEAGPGVHTLTHVSGGTTLTAQFAAFGVQVESADPAKGSITLAWTDLGGGVTYSVWRGAGESRADAECVTNGLAGTTWTDNDYWCADPVLKPLNYWVVAEGAGYGERESNRVETRHRYGVFVGVGKFKSSNSPDPSDIGNAELFGRLAREKGGFTVKVFTGTGAKKKTVRETIQSLAEQMQTGDYAVLFFSSHGDDTLWKRIRNWMDSGVALNFASIDLYDDDYGKSELASDLERLFDGKNGVGVVVVVNSCLSGGAVESVSAEGQIGWITSCADGEATPSWTSTLGTPLPLFLLEYGWSRGMAGAGEFVTFGELANYARPALGAFLDRMSWVNHPVVKGETVLEHFVAGWHGNATHATMPAVPSGVDATTEDAKLRVGWKAQSDADWFLMERTTVPATSREAMIADGSSTGGEDPSADLYGKSYFYRVAAMNEWGISGWSDSATGSRHNPELVEWVKHQCDCGDAASPATLAELAASSSSNGASYEACYVAGIDPNDPNAAFEAELVREDGKWLVKPRGGLKEGRVYRVEAKKAMSDEVWTDVTAVEDLAAEGWRFFRVGVELAE